MVPCSTPWRWGQFSQHWRITLAGNVACHKYHKRRKEGHVIMQQGSPSVTFQDDFGSVEAPNRTQAVQFSEQRKSQSIVHMFFSNWRVVCSNLELIGRSESPRSTNNLIINLARMEEICIAISNISLYLGGTWSVALTSDWSFRFARSLSVGSRRQHVLPRGSQSVWDA